MRSGLVAALVVFTGCAQTPPSKEAAAKLTMRVSHLSTDTASRAITPADVVATARCEGGGTIQLDLTTSGTSPVMVTNRQTFDACRTGDERLSGQLTSTWTVSSSARVDEVTVTHTGALAYEGPTYAGNFQYEALRMTTRVERLGDRVRLTSVLNGAITIGGTRHTYNDETYSVELALPSLDGGTSTGGGSATGGGAAGGAAMGGGSSSGTTILGARRITDLAVSGDTAYFTGETVADQSALFSASATSNLASVICTGPANTRLSGVLVDGTTLYALSDTATGSARKLLRSSTTGIGAACAEVATVDAKGFYALEAASLAKVGDLIVYKAPDGSLKGYSVASNQETVVAQPGNGFFDTIPTAGGIGVVAPGTGWSEPARPQDVHRRGPSGDGRQLRQARLHHRRRQHSVGGRCALGRGVPVPAGDERLDGVDGRDREPGHSRPHGHGLLRDQRRRLGGPLRDEGG